MRTFEGTLRALLVGGLLAAAPAHALDGSKTDPSVGPPPMSPVEAFRSGANWLKAGETVKTTLLPFTMAGSRLGVRLDPPKAGEHSRELLAGLGLGENRITELLASGVVG